MNKNICTLSDQNYLIKGLALYHSLMDNTNIPFNLYYLCMDNFTYDFLIKENLPNIYPINISNLEKDTDFTILKKNTEYVANSHECTYCFALSSFFTEYVVRVFKLPEITYIDSDIIFYEDIKYLYDSIGDKQIGIIKHRHLPIGHAVGGYNVGVMYFSGKGIGYECLKWWRDCVMDKTNKWYPKYGKVGGGDGDQKYLEAFEPLFGSNNIKILDDDIGHGAPWNFRLYRYDFLNNIIFWGNKKQKMIFIHFSHFTPDYENNNYRIDRFGEWQNVDKLNNNIKQYYDNYFITLKKLKEKYKL